MSFKRNVSPSRRSPDGSTLGGNTQFELLSPPVVRTQRRSTRDRLNEALLTIANNTSSAPRVVENFAMVAELRSLRQVREKNAKAIADLGIRATELSQPSTSNSKVAALRVQLTILRKASKNRKYLHSKEIEQLKDANTEAVKSIKLSYKDQIRKHIAENDALRTDLIQVRADKKRIEDELGSQLIDQTAVLDSLKEQLQIKEAEVEISEKEKKSKDDTISSLKKSLEDEKVARQLVETQVETLTSEVDAFKVQYRTISNENYQLKNSLAESDSTIDYILERITQLVNGIDPSSSTAKGLVSILEDAMSSINSSAEPVHRPQPSTGLTALNTVHEENGDEEDEDNKSTGDDKSAPESSYDSDEVRQRLLLNAATNKQNKDRLTRKVGKKQP